MHATTHQADGMDQIAEAMQAFGEQVMGAVPVGGTQEYGTAEIAAQDGLVQAAGGVKARFASHAGKLLQWRHI